jgi:hypothetical protein
MSISDLGNPILSKFAIASARSAPTVRADGSLSRVGVSVAVEVAAPAGEGVDGTTVAVVLAWKGAAGWAGVAVVAGAGVDGALAVDGPATDAATDAGGALGFEIVRTENRGDVNAVYL